MPLDGATHFHQTVLLVGTPERSTGSPGSTVASTVVPGVEPEAPPIGIAFTQASLPGIPLAGNAKANATHAATATPISAEPNVAPARRWAAVVSIFHGPRK